jgi:hypothetical protein
MKKILALFVAFGGTMRPKHRTKFGRMQVVKCANDQVDVGAHDDFQFCRELVEKRIKGVKEAEIRFVVACLCARMVNGGKSEGKLFVALFPLHLFSNSIIACQHNIYADESPHEFTARVSCDRWSSPRSFPTLMLAR